MLSAPQREPTPTDYCGLHSTAEEAAQAIAAAYPTDPELQEIFRKHSACMNELKQIQDQAATKVIAALVLDKMRRGTP